MINLTSIVQLKHLQKLASLFILFTILGFSCESQEPKNKEGEIYLRIVQDLSYPSNTNGDWCQLVSGCYKDNNTAMPDNAAFDIYYGPIEPGTYQASYCFDKNSTSSYNTVSFTYTVERPEPGKKRMYTRLIRDYSNTLNRCLDVSKDPAYMSYTDEPL